MEDEQQQLKEKREINPKADDKNQIAERYGRTILVCGAKRKNKNAKCLQVAGAGTDHLGSGRCNRCGGASTGPKTEEGKRRVSQNSRIHGLYASTLNEEGQEIYDELAEQKLLGLENEIYMLKAQIIQHLRNWKGKKDRRRVAVEGSLNSYEWYQPGTIDDRAYVRALEALGRLVEKHARLTPDGGDDLLGQVNAELRAASKGKVSISWGGEAQARQNPVDTPKNSGTTAGK
ncbi:hypothetical protein [Paenibacillus sp. Root444D2]|uniref:hypothetical protein n=1 Tax=Paenibacillus sp. Root444D2 TaxID=1736538 RepID=UPI00070AB6DF|nr:hypothetical protein [Paenibacillus sp. Root444D2]KQX69301.1 hypothetical protein ASD40_02020 [Paenibacillus sp. Root444D2]